MAAKQAEFKYRKKGDGLSRTIGGLILALIALVSVFAGAEAVLPLSMGAYIGRLVRGGLFALGLVLLYKGFRIRALSSKLSRVSGLFDTAQRVPLSLAADAMGGDLTSVVQSVREAQKLGMIHGLYADLIRKDLVYTVMKEPGAGGFVLADQPVPTNPPDDGVQLIETHKRSVLPIYALGLTWAVYAIFLPMYRGIDYVLAAILSLIVYFLSSWNAPQRVIITEQRTVRPAPAATGNEALDEMLRGVQIHMENLERLDKAIDGKLDAPVKDILKTTRQIVEKVTENPRQAGEMRQFFNYTLPTTISLLQNYDELSRQPSKGENIRQAMSRIEQMMDSIVETFHRQLDNLFRDKALDIEVELEVMQSMLGHKGDIRDTGDDFR